MNIVDGMTSLTWTQMSTFSPLPDSLALERLNNIASTNIPSPAISAPLDISQQSRSSCHSAASSSQSFALVSLCPNCLQSFVISHAKLGILSLLTCSWALFTLLFSFLSFLGSFILPVAVPLIVLFALLSCFWSTCFTHFERVSPYLSEINAIMNSMTIY